MLLVKTKIGPSKISGMGLFADQPIKKGTTVWQFAPGFDIKISKEKLGALSAAAKEQFLKYAYLDGKTDEYILCFDDARFFNHSDDPNCEDIDTAVETELDVTTAAKDISPGEELTCNYRVFDGDVAHKLSA